MKNMNFKPTQSLNLFSQIAQNTKILYINSPRNSTNCGFSAHYMRCFSISPKYFTMINSKAFGTNYTLQVFIFSSHREKIL